jgi:predicted enzyme related to lactoylglutathione lyase
MASPVVHFEIASTDPAGTKRFVAEMFEWKLEEIPGSFDYSMVDTGVDGAIRGGVGAAPTGEGHTTFYVQVDEVQTALDKAKKLGGQAVMGPQEIPGGSKIGLITTPAGQLLGVIGS